MRCFEWILLGCLGVAPGMVLLPMSQLPARLNGVDGRWQVTVLELI